MATLYRNERTRPDGTKEGFGNWYWAVYDPARVPKRKRVNLHTTDRKGAEQRAALYERKMMAEQFDPWAQGIPQEGVTLPEAAARYLRWKGRTASPTTIENDRGHLDRLARWMPAGAFVRHVERRHVEAFLNRPKKVKEGAPAAERSPASKVRTLATIRHFFGWAVEHGIVRDDPTAGVKPPKARANRRDHITAAEATAILRKVEAAEVLSGEPRDWLKDWLAFGVATGLRPGEQAQLRWSAVRLAERTVEVGKGHRTKTAGSARTVPVRGAALDVLRRRAEARKGEADGPVFTGAGGAAVNVGYLSKCLQGFAKEANVEKNVTAYSLRHAFGSQMTNGGAPIYDVARLMGTSVLMIERHYGHYDPARGADHLERVFGAGDGGPAAVPQPEPVGHR